MTCPWPDCDETLGGLGLFCHGCGRYSEDAPGAEVGGGGINTASPAEARSGPERGSNEAQVFSLPVPPSVNAMWRSVARLKGLPAVKKALGTRSFEALSRALDKLSAFSTLVLSAEGRRFKKDADRWLAAQGLGLVEGPVSILVTFYLPRRGSDVDNRLKPLLDVLEGRLYENDRQVAHLAAWKRIDRENPRAVVRVEPGEGPADPFEGVAVFGFDLDF